MVRDFMLKPKNTKKTNRVTKNSQATKRKIKVKDKQPFSKKLYIASIILVSLAVLAVAGLGTILTILNVLPLKWLIISWAAIALFSGLMLFFAIRKKTKKISRVFMCILSSVVTILGGWGAYYLVSTASFMEQIDNGQYKKEIFDVVVLDKSEYHEVSDLTNKTVGTNNEKNDSYNQATAKLHEMVDIEEKTDYKDYFELAKGISDGETESILLSDTYYAILREFDKEFASKTRILYTIEIWVPVDVDETNSVDVTSEPFNIFISGVDTYDDIKTTARSDVNMVVTVNPKTHHVLLTSIPRDYYVQLHNTTGVRDKLTHAGVYGVDMSIATVEDLLNIKIHYYVRVNFSSVVGIVDAIGGINIDSDASFVAKGNKSCKFTKGTQFVDGKCALAYARERKAYASGDRHRLLNQQQVLDAIVKKITTSTVLLSKYTDILNSLQGSFQTNLSSDSIYGLVNHQLDGMPSWKIESYSLDGTSAMQPTYSMGARPLYVMEPNLATVEEAKARINLILVEE